MAADDAEKMKPENSFQYMLINIGTSVLRKKLLKIPIKNIFL